MTDYTESVAAHSQQDRARGILLGLACGDALGRPVEFKSPLTITETYGTLDEMVGSGTHNQPQGTITDDTEMMLCIARSLVEHDGFEPDDIASRFIDWYESGPFDIGLMTRDAITKLQQGVAPSDAGKHVWKRRAEGSNAGNGSLMRCAPYGIAYRDNLQTLATVARSSSRITHYDKRCRDACVALTSVLAGYLTDADDVLAMALSHDLTVDVEEAVQSVAAGTVTDADLENSGYVISTLQTALYDATTTTSAKEAVVQSVSRGGDADTLGAVTGAIAGARFGASALPESWVDTVDEADELIRLADELLEISSDR